jgi:hypothetical protein
MTRRLLIVAHCPSGNTRALKDALIDGATQPEVEDVAVLWRLPLAAGPEDVRGADALILMTPENLGYMSGAMKDFFDRVYYPCLDHTQGMPYAAAIRAGHDGTGTRRAIEAIVTGLRWRAVRPPLIWRGAWQQGFLDEARELGLWMAAGLDAGIL